MKNDCYIPSERDCGVVVDIGRYEGNPLLCNLAGYVEITLDGVKREFVPREAADRLAEACETVMPIVAHHARAEHLLDGFRPRRRPADVLIEELSAALKDYRKATGQQTDCGTDAEWAQIARDAPSSEEIRAVAKDLATGQP